MLEGFRSIYCFKEAGSADEWDSRFEFGVEGSEFRV